MQGIVGLGVTAYGDANAFDRMDDTFYMCMKLRFFGFLDTLSCFLDRLSCFQYTRICFLDTLV